MSDWENAPNNAERKVRDNMQLSSMKTPEQLDGMSVNSDADIKRELKKAQTEKDDKGWETASAGWETAPVKEGLGKQALGLGEAGLNMVSQMPGGLGGGLTYLASLALTKGDTDAAMAVKKGTEDRINRYLKYEPRTKAGKDIEQIIGEGFGDAIDAGGATGKFVGGNAGEAIGRAGTEMAMNVLPFEGLIPGMKGRAVDVAASNAKMNAVPEHITPVEPPVAVPPAPTMAHADDFGTINPYNVGGHVSELQAGRPTTIDSLQPDLFGGHQEGAIPPPQAGELLNQVQHGGNEIPFQNSLVDRGQEQPIPQPKADLQMPMAPDRLSLEEPTPYRPKQPSDYPQMPENNQGMVDAFKKAQEDAAYAEKQKIAKAAYETQTTVAEQQAIAQRAGELDYQHAVKSGDKSLMGPEQTTDMINSLRENNVGGALKAIADYHTNPAYRDLAQYLTDKIQGIKVKLHDEAVIQAGERNVTGYFDPTTNTVGFSGRGAASPHTVLHELVHGLTSQFLRTRPTSAFSMGIRSIYSALETKGKFKGFDHVVNEREFLAEAFSNPEFQTMLKNVNIADTGAIRSAWGKFVQNVKNVLGIAKPEMVNALDHTLDLGKRVIEQSDQSFRNTAAEKLTSAGVPGKLRDLMQGTSDTPKVVQTGPTESRIEMIKKMSPAAQALQDFIPEKFTMDQIREAARGMEDVKQNPFQKAANQFTSGALYQSLKTKNIIVKKTYEVMGEASDRAQTLINKYVKDDANGILSAMRDLSLREKAEAVSMRILADAEQRELNSHSLSAAGFTEKQIAYVLKQKNTMDAALKSINEARASMGKKPVDPRLGYAVSKMTGDFRRPVFRDSTTRFDQNGLPLKEFIGQIGSDYRIGLNKIAADVAAKHPEWTIGEEKFLGRGSHREQSGTRESAYREAVQFLQDNSHGVEDLVKVLHDSFVGDAYDYMNAKKHTMAKKGTFGSEGREAWKSSEDNALNFMKGEVTYAETMFRWGELSKGVSELAPLLSDETIKMPNAKEWANKYIDQALGINPSEFGRSIDNMMGALAKQSGVGTTPMMNVMRTSKKLTNTVLLSLNHMYLAVNALQPLQGMPVVKNLLTSRGLQLPFDFGTGYKSLFDGALTTLKSSTNGKLSPFEQQMMAFGKRAQIFGNEILDSSSLISKDKAYYAEKVTSLGINSIESGTNQMVFAAVSHMLDEAGMKTSEGLFETAFKLTKMVMHDYRPIEAPMGFNVAGAGGTLAKNLTKYRTGQASQMMMLAREIPNNAAFRPLAAGLITQAAFGGILGIMGFQEADWIVTQVSKKMGHPTTLTKLVLDHIPDLFSYGMGSVIGLDLTNRLGNPSFLPDTLSQAFFGGSSKIADIATAGYHAVTSPSEMNTKRLVREVTPGSFTGPMDRSWFSTTNAKGEEMGVSRKPSDFHNVQGQVIRNDTDKMWKDFGATGMHESREKTVKYNNDVVSKNYDELRKGVISDLADDYFSKGRLDPFALKQAREKYMKYEGDPNSFAANINKEIMDQKTSAQQRDMLQNSNNNVTNVNKLKRMFNR